MSKSKLTSLVGKVRTIKQDGMEPMLQGLKNFQEPTPEIEALAKQRAAVCAGCDFRDDEPIETLQVTDKANPQLSDKMCGDCFCTLPYLVRQNIKPCHKWK